MWLSGTGAYTHMSRCTYSTRTLLMGEIAIFSDSAVLQLLQRMPYLVCQHLAASVAAWRLPRQRHRAAVDAHSSQASGAAWRGGCCSSSYCRGPHAVALLLCAAVEHAYPCEVRRCMLQRHREHMCTCMMKHSAARVPAPQPPVIHAQIAMRQASVQHNHSMRLDGRVLLTLFSVLSRKR